MLLNVYTIIKLNLEEAFMTFDEAKELLIYYNKWRRDNNVPNSYEMPNPKEIGKAIDVAVEALSKCINLENTSYNELNKASQEND